MTAPLEGVSGQHTTPQPHFTPRKDPVPILQEAGWAPGLVWTGRKSRPHWESIADRSARSSVAILTELPGPLIAIRHKFKLSTYVQDLLVIGMRGCVQREI